VTSYGVDGPGSNPCGGRFSAPVQTDPGAHPTSCTMRTESFPEDKERPGRDAHTSPPSSAVVMKGYSYTFTPPMGCTACTEPQCLYKDALYLYRVSVPVQGCTLPVQSLSDCTSVHFTCTEPQCLYKRALYLYRASVPV
jgi:hypothetical protein